MNFYLIILVFFIVIGVMTTAWGWLAMRKERERKVWPVVNGVITFANAVSEQDDLLPDIRFQYAVGECLYNGALAFPAGTTPIPGFAERYVEKYPVGRDVPVLVDPEQPENAVLEATNQSGGNGLIVLMGVAMVLLGSGAILFRG